MLYVIDHVTGDLSILFTVAVSNHVLPYASVNVKSYVPLPVNVYQVTPTTHVLLNVIEAITSVLVSHVMLYVIAHVTGDLSIRLTVANVFPVLPYASVNVKSYVPLPVNVYQVMPTTHVLLNVIEAITSVLVNHAMLYVIDPVT
jgi:hypothetical protein